MSISTGTRLHPASFVDPAAQLGVDVEVGPGTLVGPDVRIGDGTRIGAHAFLTGWTRIGSSCRIHHGAADPHTEREQRCWNEAPGPNPRQQQE